MNWSIKFADRVRDVVPLADLTWFRLGGSARYLFSPTSVDELRDAWRQATSAGVPVRVLGAGANLLVRDEGFEGLVMRLDAPAFTAFTVDGDRVRGAAGANLMELSRECSYGGMAGLEFLAGIPGTVGGAVTMNAGGRYGQIADVVDSVTLLRPNGLLETVSGEDMGFGYRASAVGERIVVEAVFRVEPQPAGPVKERFQRIWREKKDSQPMADHSAGCIFRNPPGDSAGRLIDASGLKGRTVGRARVSPVHGNFIVADSGAKSADVLALIDEVRTGVERRTGVRLDLEIAVW